MNVVISGSASGIGKATAQLFVSQGHQVFGYDVKDQTILHKNYHHLTYDVRTEGAPDIVTNAQIVINSAGTLQEDDALAVNLVGTMRFTEWFVDSPELRSVLFVASASARNGAEFPRYVASKAGIVGYMKNLALALAPRGVTCNSVSPGGVITPANQHILDDEDLYAAVRAETLLGKWAHPEEIAELVYFLTVTNRSITGEDILVDNGEMLKSNFIW